MADETKPTRKGSPPIKVYCLPDERRAIEEKAAAAGMSLSAYLLAVGQGYKITGVVDYEHVREGVPENDSEAQPFIEGGGGIEIS
nr:MULTISPECIES: hypothetical protein [Bacteria]